MRLISLKDTPSQPVSHQANIFKKVLIENGEVPHLTNFSQAVLNPGEKVEPHSHAKYEIFLVESGKGIFLVGALQQEVGLGDCVVIEPNEQHTIIVTGEAPLVLTYFGLAE